MSKLASTVIIILLAALVLIEGYGAYLDHEERALKEAAIKATLADPDLAFLDGVAACDAEVKWQNYVGRPLEPSSELGLISIKNVCLVAAEYDQAVQETAACFDAHVFTQYPSSKFLCIAKDRMFAALPMYVEGAREIARVCAENGWSETAIGKISKARELFKEVSDVMSLYAK